MHCFSPNMWKKVAGVTYWVSYIYWQRRQDGASTHVSYCDTGVTQDG